MLEEVASTQDVASLIVAGPLQADVPEVVFAHHQSAGRGRRGRVWASHRGESLTASLIFWDESDHPQPHLLGMSVAVAAATVIGARVQWPNDIVSGGKKLGGVIAEIHHDREGRSICIVGLGVNVLQTGFSDEISARATSVLLEFGVSIEPYQLLDRILREIRSRPAPKTWSELADHWMELDSTQDKQYRLADGRVVVAIGVGPVGELLYDDDGAPGSAYAADAFVD